MKLLQRVNDMEKITAPRFFSYEDITRFRIHDVECYTQIMPGVFSYILSRITPDGIITSSINNLEPGSLKLEPDKIDMFFNRHKHNYIEMGYVCKGQLNMEISGNNYCFQENEVFFIDCNCLHSEKLIEANNAVFYLCMSNEFFDEILLQEIEEQPLQQFIRTCLIRQKNSHQFIHFIPRSTHDLIEGLLEQVIDESDQNAKGYEFIIKGLMLRIMDILINSYDSHLTRMEKPRRDELIFQEIERYLRNNYSCCKISDLVSNYHYSEDYFNKLIRQYTNFTFSQFLQDIRLKKAEEMLVKSEFSVTKIIQDVGYANRGYFYKLFFQRNGVKPEEYRINCRQKMKKSE
jgi:AraC-like DNA-binding protein